MNPQFARRLQGTTQQQQAQQVQALATKIIQLKRDTRLNAQQRLELIRFLATR